jgi:uncharacterized protein (DUF1499 family)
MKATMKLMIRLLVLFLAIYIGFVAMNVFSKPKGKIGLQADGTLAACPDSPNCVSSFASDGDHGIEPISFEGDAAECFELVKRVLAEMPRIKVVEEDDNYLHATATTLIMRYVDDVEFTFDAQQKLLHFRSASRIGYSDLGANRARMETFRKQFLELGGS